MMVLGGVWVHVRDMFRGMFCVMFRAHTEVRPYGEHIFYYYCPLNIHIPIPTLCNTGFGIFCYLRQAPSSVF